MFYMMTELWEPSKIIEYSNCITPSYIEMTSPNVPTKNPGVETCSVCRGITVKLFGSRTNCYGFTKLVRKRTEHIPYQSSEEPLVPKQKIITIGDTVTTDKLEKENRPPIVLFGTSIVVLPNDTLQAPPKEANAKPGSINNIPEQSHGVQQPQHGNKEQVPSIVMNNSQKNQAVQRQQNKPPMTWEDVKARLTKGATKQYSAMISTYGLMTENFSDRMKKGTQIMSSRISASAGYLSKKLYKTLFEGDSSAHK